MNLIYGMVLLVNKKIGSLSSSVGGPKTMSNESR